MTVPMMPPATLPEPLATDADTAQRHAGPCHLCGRAIKPGQRRPSAAGPPRGTRHVHRRAGRRGVGRSPRDPRGPIA